MTLVTTETLARLTGLPVSSDQAQQLFTGLPDLIYNESTASDSAAIFADVEETIRENRFRIIGQGDDQAIWTKGWGEVAAAVTAAPRVTIETLKPQYYHNDVPLRMLGHYVRPQTDYFEYYLGLAVRRQVMQTYLSGCTKLVELGCGTGLNLLLAADLFPDAGLAGTDWVQPTLDILTAMGRSMGRPIGASLLDFLSGQGWDQVDIDADTDVMTFHALEQLGAQAMPAIEQILARRPRRCLHMEPLFDLYDRANPFDDIAARYHLARGYLMGLRPRLLAEAEAGRIRILADRRVQLGNLYHEAYSFIVWEPVR